MMKIAVTRSERGPRVAVKGRVDALTAIDVERALLEAAELDGELVMDLAEVDYVGSAGLRAFLVASRALAPNGRKLILAHAAPTVAEVIRLTGFDKILVLEDEQEASS